MTIWYLKIVNHDLRTHFYQRLLYYGCIYLLFKSFYKRFTYLLSPYITHASQVPQTLALKTCKINYVRLYACHVTKPVDLLCLGVNTFKPIQRAYLSDRIYAPRNSQVTNITLHSKHTIT